MPKTQSRAGRRAGGRLPRISDSEWVVMRVVWDRAPVTANQVVEALAGQAEWKPKTIHTLLKRLVQKGALGFEKNGREYLYQPRVDAQECERAASHSFLQRVFDGKVAPFLACFLEREKLTAKEIDELKHLLEAGRR